MAAALNQLQNWLGLTAFLAIRWQCGAQQLFSATAGYVLAFVALCQPFFVGLVVWLLRFRSPLPLMLGYFVSFQAAELVLFLLELAPGSAIPAIVLGAAAVLAVLGVILTWDGYRRWLLTDFD